MGVPYIMELAVRPLMALFESGLETVIAFLCLLIFLGYVTWTAIEACLAKRIGPSGNLPLLSLRILLIAFTVILLIILVSPSYMPGSVFRWSLADTVIASLAAWVHLLTRVSRRFSKKLEEEGGSST